MTDPLTQALAGWPEDFAVACREALQDIDGSDADRASRQIELADPAGGAARRDVVVTNRARATCDAPNCAGHRTRA
jgi:hypothetical protein